MYNNSQKHLTKHMFSGTVVPVGRSMFSGFEKVAINVSNKNQVYLPITTELTSNDLKVIKTIYTEYSLYLSEKLYEHIPMDQTLYTNLWNGLCNFKLPVITSNTPGSVSDGSIQLMVQIAQDALCGIDKIPALYTKYLYTRIKIVELIKEENEILSEKNRIRSLISDDGSQFIATKNFYFSALYSNYIYFYGMPAYGEGFDQVKVDFIQRLLDLVDAYKTNPTSNLEETILQDYEQLDSNLSTV